ncbi:MAG: polysaccharide lyase 8 family protein [Phenylobacterium sp.]|uniref:polysaccharide lyase 8 family protein n=1 Tax=Phenylobacterium sp. TaxID=1871053 RepID=UPI002732775F|nr:polysaccharide lyase 8 family protein [Phenylobacterium sp.]MDP3749379.1 polysaccharide lyase 8 family protein [Phenylobacterium sp.]
MSLVNRRAALLAPAALIGPPRALAAEPATDDRFERLRDRWIDMLTGGSALDPRSPPYDAIVRGVADNARQWWGVMADPRTGPGALWNDPASGLAEYNSRISADRLRVMALAFSTPGSALAGDPRLKADLVEALAWFEARRYSIRIERSGNWWEWEIGIPTALTDLLLLLRPILQAERPGLLERLVAAIDRFTPHADVGTAANTVWRSHVVALNAILARDAAKLESARRTFPTTFEDVKSGDGFHADGSFIQHDDLAYTGGYGRDMLSRSALLIHLLDGSPWALASAEWAKLAERIGAAFAPVMFRGALMDMTRGRNISRANLSDIRSGQAVIHALLYLGQVPGGAGLRSQAKAWIAAQSGVYDVFAYDPRLPAYWMTPYTARLASNLIRDRSVPTGAEVEGCRVFPAMERAVFRTGGVAVALAMSSARIANYESVNGENLEGWYTGQGMTYVYGPGHENFADDFWPTVDPYRLPGVTLDKRPRAPAARVARNTSSAVGGAELADCAAVGMRLETDAGGFRATKSWFAADGYVVSLGAGISSDHPSVVETVLENRNLGASAERRVLTDAASGERLTRRGDIEIFEQARWLHLEGYGGVVLPGGADVRGLREIRQGAWSRINQQGASPTGLRSRTYATFWLDHGVRPVAASYAYVLLPGRGVAQTRAFEVSGAVAILDNDARIQGVRLEGPDVTVHAANFWTALPGRSGEISASGAVCVAARVGRRRIEIALADPTQAQTSPIEIELTRGAATLVSPHSALEVGFDRDRIRMRFDPRGLSGRSAVVVLARA